MPLSTYGKDLVAMAMTGQAALPGSLWLAFTTQLAGADDDGSVLFESTAGSAARQYVDMSAGWSFPTLGKVTYDTIIEFSTYEAWGTFTSYALCTADVLGSVFAFDYLASPLTVQAGATITIPISAFSIQVA